MGGGRPHLYLLAGVVLATNLESLFQECGECHMPHKVPTPVLFAQVKQEQLGPCEYIVICALSLGPL